MLLTMMLVAVAATMTAGNYEVNSPNGKVKVTMTATDAVSWSVTYDGKTLLQPSEINIEIRQGNKTFGLGKVGKVAVKAHGDYGQLLMYTNQKMTIEVRAYDDGAAYRLISGHTKPVTV